MPLLRTWILENLTDITQIIEIKTHKCQNRFANLSSNLVKKEINHSYLWLVEWHGVRIGVNLVARRPQTTNRMLTVFHRHFEIFSIESILMWLHMPTYSASPIHHFQSSSSPWQEGHKPQTACRQSSG